ncbi:MAG: hypothetical protein JSW05_05150 [Candidatus Thorarchaeota archaeon]|nr:MAG: hypothetical protein JSW05_05150 [Candidatus Thorarchaeota archaeon]
MPLVGKSRVLDSMHQAGYLVHAMQLGMKSQTDEVPFIVLSHEVYPGVEAHLFTIADAALWLPAFNHVGDIVLYRPREFDGVESAGVIEKARSDAWNMLLSAVERIGNLLTPYKEHVSQGITPKTVWAHHETQWHLALRDAPDHEAQPVDKFIDDVDSSIRPHIRELNELGFATKESCSGILDEHPDREPYRPYVMFDDRVYLDASAHLFTLADIAEWIPGPGPHGFDVSFHQNVGEDIQDAWQRLRKAAHSFAPLINQYRTLVGAKDRQYRRLRKVREVPKIT